MKTFLGLKIFLGFTNENVLGLKKFLGFANENFLGLERLLLKTFWGWKFHGVF